MKIIFKKQSDGRVRADQIEIGCWYRYTDAPGVFMRTNGALRADRDSDRIHSIGPNGTETWSYCISMVYPVNIVGREE